MGLRVLSYLLRNRSEVRFSFNLPLFLSLPCVWSRAQSPSYSTKVVLSHSPFLAAPISANLHPRPRAAIPLLFRTVSYVPQPKVKCFALSTHHNWTLTFVSTVHCWAAKYKDNAAFSRTLLLMFGPLASRTKEQIAWIFVADYAKMKGLQIHVLDLIHSDRHVRGYMPARFNDQKINKKACLRWMPPGEGGLQ